MSTGKCAAASYIYRKEKGPLEGPLDGRELLFQYVSTLDGYLSVLLLGTVPGPQLDIVYPRTQRASHIHATISKPFG